MRHFRISRKIGALALLAGTAALVTLLTVPAGASPTKAAKPASASSATTLAKLSGPLITVDEGIEVEPSGTFQPTDANPPEPEATENPAVLAGSRAAGKTSSELKPTGQPDGPLAPPAFQQQFTGTNATSCCGRPPDTHGAIGLNHFVEVTNPPGGVARFNRGGALVAPLVSLNSFFGYATQTIFDPRVVYDKVWNRWVIVAEAFQESATIQRVFIAASTTNNPTGTWCIYNFDVPEPSGDFFDYPMVGMDQDAIIITANIFTGNTYVRSRMLAPPKAALYNCRGFSVPYFNLGTPGTTAPPIVEDDNRNTYLLGATVADNTHLHLFRANNLGRSGATVVLQSNVVVPAFFAPPEARQPGSGLLDTIPARFVDHSTQLADQLLNVHTIAAGSFPINKWYQVDTEGAGANSVPAGRSGFVFENSTSDDWNASVAGSPVGGTTANPIGRMFFTWSATDAVNPTVALRHQARVKMSGRLQTDSTTLTGGSTVFQSAVAYNPTADNPERWGDYSSTTLDPNTPGCALGRAWGVNEKVVSSTLWGSHIGRVGYC